MTTAIQPKRARISTLQIVNAQPMDIRAYSDEGAEEALIGAVLMQPDLYAAASEYVKADDFFYLKHGYIWHAIDQLSGRGDGIDPATVASELQTITGAADVADIGYLASLMGKTFDIANLETYAKTIIDNALRLRIMKAAEEITRRASDKTMTVETMLSECEFQLMSAMARKVESPTDVSTLMGSFYEQVERGLAEGKSPGVPYGWRALDEALGGMYPGEVTVMAGPPGFGKTTVALSVLRNMVMAKRRVAFFSVEMAGYEIIRSLTAMEAKLYVNNLKAFKLTPQDWARFVAASGRISQWNAEIVDEFMPLSPVQVRRKLRKLGQFKPVEAVIIDGLWLMNADDRTKERHEEVRKIMDGLSQIARDFSVPILLLHQFNQDVKARSTKEPTLYDLAESSAVARTAQNIFGLYRPTFFDKREIDSNTYLHVLKGRTGGRGLRFVLRFDETSQSYTGADDAS